MNKYKYSIIYADPPWTYRVWSKKGLGRSAASHYNTMSLERIKALPVKEIVAKDSVLFLWVTYPNLPEGLEVMKAWGFNYKTVAFTWVKRNKKSDTWFWGMGYWTRANPEICLLGTRGHPKRKSKRVHSIIDERIRDHSRKPDIVRDKIVELMGDLPRIELFAREKVPGWDSIGFEIDGKDIFQSLEEILKEIKK